MSNNEADEGWGFRNLVNAKNYSLGASFDIFSHA